MGRYVANDNVVVHWIPPNLNSNSILSNDVITIYGTFTGLEQFKMIDGSKEEWPAITAKYIDDNGQISIY